jgi:hypothetical protein
MMRWRRGFLTTEALVGTAVMGMILGILSGVHRLSERHGRSQGVRADGIRSALLAFRTIRADLSRVNRLKLEQAVEILDGGRGIRLVTSQPDSIDLWDLKAMPVTYTLEGVRGSRTDYCLVRRDERGRRVIPGVILKGVTFSNVSASALSTQVPAVLVRLELPAAQGSWCPTALMALQASTAPAFYDDLGDEE